MTLVPRVLELLRQQGQERVQVLVGGIIPDDDIPALREFGSDSCFRAWDQHAHRGRGGPPVCGRPAGRDLRSGGAWTWPLEFSPATAWHWPGC